MNKQELLENYTQEQLADKIIALNITINDMKNTEKIIKQYNSKQCDCGNVGVIIKCPDCGKENKFEFDEKSSQLIRNKLTDKIHILEDENEKLKNASEVKNDEIQRLKWTISNLEESNGRLQASVDTYVNFILPRATKEAKELLDKNAFPCIRIVAIGEEKMKCDFGERDEIDRLRKELQRKGNIIKQIDDILEKLFGIRHDIAKPNEFEKILREKIENNKTLEDFLPLEPIKVADALINAKRLWGIFCSENGEEKVECKYHLYSFEKLRQIAQHLLVYCDANKED